LARKVRILKVNQATLALFHVKDENTLYQGLHKIFNKESYDVFKEELIALSEGKSHFDSVAVNRTLTGDEINVLLKLVVPPGYERTLSSVFVFIIDITAQIKQQTHLQKSAEKYRQIMQTAPDAILVADIESGIIIEANTKAEELLTQLCESKI
jgi:PAS domain-containing protein